MYSYNHGDARVVLISIEDAKLLAPYLKYSNFVLSKLTAPGFQGTPHAEALTDILAAIDGSIRKSVLQQRVSTRVTTVLRRTTTRYKFGGIGNRLAHHPLALFLHHPLGATLRNTPIAALAHVFTETLDARLPGRPGNPNPYESRAKVATFLHYFLHPHIAPGAPPLCDEQATAAFAASVNHWKSCHPEAQLPWIAPIKWDSTAFRAATSRILAGFAADRRCSVELIRKQLGIPNDNE